MSDYNADFNATGLLDEIEHLNAVCAKLQDTTESYRIEIDRLRAINDELVAICERIRDCIIGDGITPSDLDALYAAIAKAKEQPKKDTTEM
jgi:hypothetical protein